MAMTWKQVSRLGCKLPEVEEGIWFRTPALKVRGKSFCRLREDAETIVFILESVDEQEFLIESQKKIFFITDHYRGYAAVCARLSALTPPVCEDRLRKSWLNKAPKKLVKEFLAADGGTPEQLVAKSARRRARSNR